MIRLGSSGISRLVTAPDLSRMHEGYPPGGPQDRRSCATANRLLGNEARAGALEFTLLAPEVRFQQECHFVLGGAPCEISLNERRLADWTVHHAPAGSLLKVRMSWIGCRVYLCIAGGGVVPDEDEQTFGFAGNPNSSTPGLVRPEADADESWAPPRGVLRILPGPEFHPGFLDEIWQVSTESSGMGARLNGPELDLPGTNITSSPVQDGVIQATGKGLIALLRDRGTIGGYPRLATIVDDDVDRLAQLRPGATVRFQDVTEGA